jgi:hypothetical protein
MVCCLFLRNRRFNKDKTLGILVKKSESYIGQNEIVSGRCTVYGAENWMLVDVYKELW